jgi:hypothetical protein
MIEAAPAVQGTLSDHAFRSSLDDGGDVTAPSRVEQFADVASAPSQLVQSGSRGWP